MRFSSSRLATKIYKHGAFHAPRKALYPQPLRRRAPAPRTRTPLAREALRIFIDARVGAIE